MLQNVAQYRKMIGRFQEVQQRKHIKQLAAQKDSKSHSVKDTSWPLIDQPQTIPPALPLMNFRGHPLLLLCFLSTLMTFAEARPTQRKDHSHSTKVEESASKKMVEQAVDAYPSQGMVSSSTGFFAAQESTQPMTAAPATEPLKKSWDTLIDDTIELNSLYRKLPSFTLTTDQADALLRKALPKAIRASNALQALQSFQGSGLKLNIDLIHELQQPMVGKNREGGYHRTVWPGQIFISIPAAQDPELLASTLANELTHARSTILISAAHFDATMDNEEKSTRIRQYEHIPCITKEECEQFGQAISQVLSTFWQLPAEQLRKWMGGENQKIARFAANILTYKIPLIEKFIQDMQKKLPPENLKGFKLILQLANTAVGTHYSGKTPEGQLAELESDLSSLRILLMAKLGEKRTNQLFKPIDKYHQMLTKRYLLPQQQKEEISADADSGSSYTF